MASPGLCRLVLVELGLKPRRSLCLPSIPPTSNKRTVLYTVGAGLIQLQRGTQHLQIDAAQPCCTMWDVRLMSAAQNNQI